MGQTLDLPVHLGEFHKTFELMGKMQDRYIQILRNERRYSHFLRIEIANKIIPIERTAMAGAGLSLISPDKNIHIAIAIQMMPITNRAFVIFCPSLHNTVIVFYYSHSNSLGYDFFSNKSSRYIAVLMERRLANLDSIRVSFAQCVFLNVLPFSTWHLIRSGNHDNPSSFFKTRMIMLISLSFMFENALIF